MSNELHPCLTCDNLTEHDHCAVCNPESYIDPDINKSIESVVKRGIMYMTGMGVDGNLERLNVCEMLLKELPENAHCYPHLAKMLIHCRQVRNTHIKQGKLEPIN